ncbi:MAG TPA: hypothetical protein P5330_03210 [Candidatus Competibacteraceae bacterium]|nr:hypothetical protein [Candidatus Competibacteraceae bacterium]
MSLTLSAWEWLSLLGGSGVALVTLLFTLGRLLLAQVERRLDSRFALLEQTRQAASAQWGDRFGQLDTVVRANEHRLTQLLIDLPLQYQRREDSIRQEVAIIHRLDALATKVDHLSTCDLRTCPIRDHHLPGTP